VPPPARPEACPGRRLPSGPARQLRSARRGWVYRRCRSPWCYVERAPERERLRVQCLGRDRVGRAGGSHRHDGPQVAQALARCQQAVGAWANRTQEIRAGVRHPRTRQYASLITPVFQPTARGQSATSLAARRPTAKRAPRSPCANSENRIKTAPQLRAPGTTRFAIDVRTIYGFPSSIAFFHVQVTLRSYSAMAIASESPGVRLGPRTLGF
jgi:hypothetical protein